MTVRMNTLTAPTADSRGHDPQGSAELHNRVELDFLLRQSFAEGVRWPIDRASLRTLLQMGLTILQIAQHFSIEPAEVQALLDPHS